MLNRPDLYEFVRIGEVAETTTQLLAINLHHGTTLGGKQQCNPQVGAMEMMVLQQAKSYVSTVKEGFSLAVRTNQATNRADLRYLLDRILVDWTSLERELGLDEGPAELKSKDSSADWQSDASQTPPPLPTYELPTYELPTYELPTYELIAFGMATVALGHLPNLPAEQITFPYSYSQPPTYADIPSPRSAAEVLWRIEELEQAIWQIMSGELQKMVNHRYGQLRRTYGFFESSALLARHESERFGVKKAQKPLSFF